MSDPHRAPSNLQLRRFALWMAEGFGTGRIAVAPGTFGSVAGFAVFFGLVATGSWPLLMLGSVALVWLSVVFCGWAEDILGTRDPGSIVLDEIAAIPVCFGVWLAFYSHQTGGMPSPAYFLSHWVLVLGVFVGFRFFDILKPWPIRQSQTLPRGWGVTLDDLLAAVYVNLAVALAIAIGALD